MKRFKKNVYLGMVCVSFCIAGSIMAAERAPDGNFDAFVKQGVLEFFNAVRQEQYEKLGFDDPIERQKGWIEFERPLEEPERQVREEISSSIIQPFSSMSISESAQLSTISTVVSNTIGGPLASSEAGITKAEIAIINPVVLDKIKSRLLQDNKTAKFETISRSGKRIAILDEHGNISLWNAKTSDLMSESVGKAEGAKSIKFSDDGKKVHYFY
jgi:hypothetical protein